VFAVDGSADILPAVTEATGQRYDLLEPIAAGGMGQVFLGRVRGEHGFQKPVAIKRILPELARNPEFVVRFVAEAKLAVSLSHANIVQVFDLGRAGDELLLVMEYVRGSDLGQLLGRLSERAQPTPAAIAVYLAMEALKGLVYAHERRELDGRTGVIHCDLSPSNLLVSWAGEVKIGDFGVAQALDVARRRRTSTSVMGKVRYLAPEQLTGDPLDPRTDLYSLAVVLHETLTARRPFDVGDVDAIAAAVIAGGHPPVSQFRSDVPVALDELIARAMQKTPRERPASAREMLAELARIAQKLDAVTPPDVGAWAHSTVEEPVIDRPRRATRSMPARDPTVSSRATMTFVVRQSVDGMTVLDREAGAGKRRRGAAVAGLVLGAALFVGAVVARRLDRTIALAPATAAPPAATSALPPTASPAPPTASAAPPTASPAPPTASPAPPTASPAPPTEHAAAPTARPARVHHSAVAPGFVNVYSDPWANVTVDGHPLGVTPLAHVRLAPGVHRLRLVNPKARPVERTVRIESGKTELIDVDLDSRR
jgi:serine/threonine-protein kinase